MVDTHKTIDQKLLQQIKKDNKLAFQELYNCYWEDLFNFGFDLLHDEQSTKDIVQDIFFNIWNNRQKIEINNTKAYLFQSVRYAVIKRIRHTELKECDLSYLVEEPYANSLEEAIDYEETHRKIETLMEDLPRRSREVFYLSRYENLTNAQIAEKLHISKTTVEWHISQVLKHFRLSISTEAFFLVLISFIL